MIAEIPPAAQRTERIFDAMRAVPRHPFIPRLAQALLGAAEVEQIIDRDADPEAWWNAVYSDSVIVTQVSDGAGEIMSGSNGPTSSASAPSTVADLLGWLDPAPGQSVLEIGTGTGWTAALLTHLVGEHGSVTTIEVDEAVAEQAAKNVVAAGAQPHMIIGDGAKGCPDRAPFDRVHVTCGVRTVPYAWVEQMMMRSQRPPDAIPDDGNGQDLTTRIDPRTIAYAPAGALLTMAALTGLQVTFKGEGDQLLLWVMDQSDPGVWTLVTYAPGRQEHEVYQLGDRPLWDEVTDAYFRWVSWGEPGRDRFGDLRSFPRSAHPARACGRRLPGRGGCAPQRIRGRP